VLDAFWGDFTEGRGAIFSKHHPTARFAQPTIFAPSGSRRDNAKITRFFAEAARSFRKLGVEPKHLTRCISREEARAEPIFSGRYASKLPAAFTRRQSRWHRIGMSSTADFLQFLPLGRAEPYTRDEVMPWLDAEVSRINDSHTREDVRESLAEAWEPAVNSIPRDIMLSATKDDRAGWCCDPSGMGIKLMYMEGWEGRETGKQEVDDPDLSLRPVAVRGSEDRENKYTD
jgi:hypothetical protein